MAFSERMGGLFSNKEYCEFCMSFICSNCVYKPKDDEDGQKTFMQRLMSKKGVKKGDGERIKKLLFFPQVVCE